MAYRLISAATLGLVTSCAGTIVVDHEIEATVSFARPDRHPGQTSANGIQRVAKPPGSLLLFDSVRYTDDLLQWHFATDSQSIGGTITNCAAGRLCFRFDAAQVASNLHPEKIPLRVFDATYLLPGGRYVKQGTTVPRDRTFFPAPSLCIDSGGSAQVSLSVDLRRLFPSNTLFNVMLSSDSPTLADKGIGNSIALTLPIEHGDGTRELSVSLVAKDSGTRISHY